MTTPTNPEVYGEAEVGEHRVRVLKGRAACSRGGPRLRRLHDGGGAGFLLPGKSGPNSPPTLVLERPRIVRRRQRGSRRVRVGVAGFSLFYLRGASFERPLRCTRTS